VKRKVEEEEEEERKKKKTYIDAGPSRLPPSPMFKYVVAPVVTTFL
jgi:hypothetical protein